MVFGKESGADVNTVSVSRSGKGEGAWLPRASEAPGQAPCYGPLQEHLRTTLLLVAWGHGKTRGFAVNPMRHEGRKLGSPWGDGKGKGDWRLSETEGAGLVTTWMWLCWVGWAWRAERGMSLEELVSVSRDGAHRRW